MGWRCRENKDRPAGLGSSLVPCHSEPFEIVLEQSKTPASESDPGFVRARRASDTTRPQGVNCIILTVC